MLQQAQKNKNTQRQGALYQETKKIVLTCESGLITTLKHVNVCAIMPSKEVNDCLNSL